MNTFNFIEKYKVPLKVCDNIIEYHKKNIEYKTLGMIGAGIINKNIKDSTDVLFYNETTNKSLKEFFSILSKYAKEYLTKYHLESPVRTSTINMIQYYKKGQGFPALHYERTDVSSSKRELVYMLYCNDLKKGGTYFPYQEVALQSKKGNLYMWPSFFTHPHQGVISPTEEKYIATGWFELV